MPRFDFNRCLSSIHSCIDSEGAISIDKYLIFFEEISNILEGCGVVPNFVAKDIMEKVDIVRQFANGPVKKRYLDFRTMLEYEINNGMVQRTWDGGGGPHGSATELLKLNRGMMMIILILDHLDEVGEDESLKKIARQAYRDSLQIYHPWAVRKLANVVMELAPDKKTMVSHFCGEHPNQSSTCISRMTALKNAIPAVKHLHNSVEDLYTEYGIADLPQHA